MISPGPMVTPRLPGSAQPLPKPHDFLVRGVGVVGVGVYGGPPVGNPRIVLEDGLAKGAKRGARSGTTSGFVDPTTDL